MSNRIIDTTPFGAAVWSSDISEYWCDYHSSTSDYVWREMSPYAVLELLDSTTSSGVPAHSCAAVWDFYTEMLSRLPCPIRLDINCPIKKLKHVGFVGNILDSLWSHVQKKKPVSIMLGPQDSLLAVKRSPQTRFLSERVLPMLRMDRLQDAWICTVRDHMWIEFTLSQALECETVIRISIPLVGKPVFWVGVRHNKYPDGVIPLFKLEVPLHTGRRSVTKEKDYLARVLEKVMEYTDRNILLWSLVCHDAPPYEFRRFLDRRKVNEVAMAHKPLFESIAANMDRKMTLVLDLNLLSHPHNVDAWYGQSNLNVLELQSRRNLLNG